jgi:DNA (cytosine-5)-methyltransferase 1
MGAVIGALGDRGYGFSYRLLDSQHFGVPQRRRRVFILGRRAGGPGWTAPARVLLEPESGGRDHSASESARSIASRRPSRSAPGLGRQRVAPPVTSKWAKGTGGPSGDETQNLVVSALTSNMAGGGGGESTTTRHRVGT